MKVKAFPKINLALDILGKDPVAGMHEIKTIFHQIDTPADELEMQRADEGIRVICEDKNIAEKENIVYKAAVLLKTRALVKDGATIHLKKNIPIGAGLGGGSSDAVAALKGLSEIWNIKDPLLIGEIARELGSDCAFFVNGGTALGTHFGEVIEPLPDANQYITAEIISTNITISSAWAYAHLDLNTCGKNVKKTEALIEALHTGDAKGIIDNAHNDFEELIFGKYPELRKLKEKMENEKGGRVILSGSGGSLVRLTA